MKLQFTIDDAVAADTDRMAAIAIVAWAPVFSSFEELMGNELFDLVYKDWKEDKASQIRNSAEPGSPVQFIVAKTGGRVVGFASWSIHHGSPEIAEIGNNAVDPEWQNNGIASALYGEIIGRCKKEGIDAVKVTTGLDSSHAPARNAYGKAGFGAGIPMVTFWQDLR